jgi:hypothetical protein
MVFLKVQWSFHKVFPQGCGKYGGERRILKPSSKRTKTAPGRSFSGRIGAVFHRKYRCSRQGDAGKPFFGTYRFFFGSGVFHKHPAP